METKHKDLTELIIKAFYTVYPSTSSPEEHWDFAGQATPSAMAFSRKSTKTPSR